eukprot:CAMPEP_0174374352 /NCGR_PEP_ID=MMETSP0811_2-20130205/110604_1 /TAXON_ID=73025 ORGANISM="Eutreptiella gymnastica-like, Strain CCMP1594" /NCGR_SAMPLE_ID=MMETSP0811_2 /ASSEMBLY_ACC=CAM_ASM_000667 /LENGTH=62 /DNA_ID=CAMNT_0015523597 /DNA_START=550 /DNA_END=741 /DNA_ORIENTATION=+
MKMPPPILPHPLPGPTLPLKTAFQGLLQEREGNGDGSRAQGWTVGQRQADPPSPPEQHAFAC